MDILAFEYPWISMDIHAKMTWIWIWMEFFSSTASLVNGHKLIATSFFQIICAITHEIEHEEKSFQLVTYSTICTGHIQHNNDDVIIVEVTMTRQKFKNC